MLIIDKGITIGEVVTIKLTSGEEILGRLVEDTDKYVKIGRPLVLTATEQGIGMVPYLFTVDPKKDVKINKPISVLEPTEAAAAKQYIQSTTTIAMI